MEGVGWRSQKIEDTDSNLKMFVILLAREMRPPERHYPAAQTQGHRKWWAAGRMKFGRAGADCSDLVDSQGVLLAEGRLPPWLGAKPGVTPDSSRYRRWLWLVLPYFSRPFLSVQRPSLPDCTN